MFGDTDRIRVSISGIGLVADVHQVSRLAFNVQKIEESDPSDSDFRLFRPGPISVERFRFSILRYPEADSANLNQVKSWWGAVQKGSDDRRTVTIELFASDNATRGLHVDLEDSVPVAFDPVSQTMTVQPGRMVLHRLFKPKFAETFSFAVLDGPTSLSFNSEMKIANQPFHTHYDVSGGGTEFEYVNTTVGTDGHNVYSLGKRRVQPMTVLMNLPPELTMVEDWIQAVLAGQDADRDVQLQQLNHDGAPGEMVFSLLDAFPTRVVLLDSSFVNSAGDAALAVRITAQADRSQ